jgi:hypothetical protein
MSSSVVHSGYPFPLVRRRRSSTLHSSLVCQCALYLKVCGQKLSICRNRSIHRCCVKIEWGYNSSFLVVSELTWRYLKSMKKSRNALSIYPVYRWSHEINEASPKSFIRYRVANVRGRTLSRLSGASYSKTIMAFVDPAPLHMYDMRRAPRMLVYPDSTDFMERRFSYDTPCGRGASVAWKMAEAGFYTPDQKKHRCYACGLTLLDAPTSPLFEHTRQNPFCTFIRNIKSPWYIDYVTSNYPAPSLPWEGCMR